METTLAKDFEAFMAENDNYKLHIGPDERSFIQIFLKELEKAAARITDLVNCKQSRNAEGLYRHLKNDFQALIAEAIDAVNKTLDLTDADAEVLRRYIVDLLKLVVDIPDLTDGELGEIGRRFKGQKLYAGIIRIIQGIREVL